ncbi:molybdate ABC transporter substrate-binding protein [Luteimonas cucumeris]|nr:molybdate ABC transporter substrate-binding protein [Luteimonas cucumeris]
MQALAAIAMSCLATIVLAAIPQSVPMPLTIFAAASLKESMDEAAAAYQRAHGQPVRVSYAASSTLARQIEQGAPADVFLSADLDWMDYLQQRQLIDGDSRRDLLGNTLVLIAPKASTAKTLLLERGVDLRPLLGDGRLALALAASVPAGKYAKAAFVSLGVWPSLRAKVAEAENVRAALMLVAREEAPLGVVYASDARAEPGVRVLSTFPASTHPRIVYPVARVAASQHPHADAFMAWLATPAAAAIFRRRGFIVL